MEAHAGGRPRLLGDGIRLQAHDHAPLAHQQQFLIGPHHLEAHQGVAIAAKLDAPQAQPGPPLQPELIHRHPLTEATGGGHQHPRTIAGGRFLGFAFAVFIGCGAVGHPVGQLCRQHIHAHQAVPLAQGHGPYPAGRAAQGAQFAIGDPEVDRHSLQGTDQNAVALECKSHPAQGISLLKANGNQAIGTDVGKGRKGRAFNEATTGEHQQLHIFFKGTNRQQ